MDQISFLHLPEDASLESYFKVGLTLWHGKEGIPINPNASLRYFLAAAKEGHIPSQLFLGDALLENVYDPLPAVDPKNHITNPDIIGYSAKNFNSAVAVSWYKRAADQNSPTGMRKLAQCLFKGHGVPQNIPLAIEFSLKASTLGDGESSFILGKYYSRFSETQDLSISFYSKSAQAKYLPGMFSVARYDTTLSPQASFTLLLEAANSNHLPSIYEVGNCFSEGYGVKANPGEARKWWGIGASQGHSQCQYQLASSLETLDPFKALEYYTKAAHQGLGMACYRLSQLFNPTIQDSFSNYLNTNQHPITTHKKHKSNLECNTYESKPVSEDDELYSYFQYDQQTSILYLKCAAYLNIQEAQLKLGIYIYNHCNQSTSVDDLFLARKWLLAGLSNEPLTESTCSIIDKTNSEMLVASPNITKSVKSTKRSDSLLPDATLNDEGRLFRLKYSLKHGINRSDRENLVSTSKSVLVAVEKALKESSPVFSALSQGSHTTHDILNDDIQTSIEGHPKRNFSNLLTLLGYSAQIDTCNVSSIPELIKILKNIQ